MSMVERITVDTSDEVLLTLFSPAQIARFRARGALPAVTSSPAPALSASASASQARNPPRRTVPSAALHSEPIPTHYRLTCGALLPPSVYIPPPRQGSIFPVIDGAERHPLRPSHAFKTNGCGVVIHEVALPYASGVWMAKGRASELVDELSYEYFDDQEGLAPAGVSHCGCQSSGVGCTECGNTLGSRTVLCAPHTARMETTELYRFLPSTVMTSTSFDFASEARPIPTPLPSVTPSFTHTFVGTPSAQALAQADEYKPDEGEARL